MVREHSYGDECDGPWRATRRGTFAIEQAFGIASVYKVDSTVAISDANFGEPSQLHGDLEGKFGAALAGEYYALDDLALFLGAELRVFEPDLGTDLIQFGDIQQNEFFLGTRWFLPICSRWSQRLRPFLQTKLAYIPAVEFDMTTRVPFDPPLNDAVMVASFKGSSYWTLGAGGGLAYQWSKAWLVSLGFFYEWPLGESSGHSAARLTQSTGNDFVDDIFNSLEYDTTLEPEGWIAFLRISYGF